MNILSVIFTPLVILLIVMIGLVILLFDFLYELFEQMLNDDMQNDK